MTRHSARARKPKKVYRHLPGASLRKKFPWEIQPVSQPTYLHVGQPSGLLVSLPAGLLVSMFTSQPACRPEFQQARKQACMSSIRLAWPMTCRLATKPSARHERWPDEKADRLPECLRAFRLTCQLVSLTASWVAAQQSRDSAFAPASLLACIQVSLMHILLAIMPAGGVWSGA